VHHDIVLYINNNRFTALCPGLPGWAGTRRNTRISSKQYLVHSTTTVQLY